MELWMWDWLWVIGLYHPCSNLLSSLKLVILCLLFFFAESFNHALIYLLIFLWIALSSASRCWYLYLMAISYCIWVLTMMNIQWSLIAVSLITNFTLFMVHSQVLLLDEVTVDLDVVARLDLLDFFKEECDQVFTCYIYNYIQMHAYTRFWSMEILKKQTLDMHNSLDTPVNHVMGNCLIYLHATCRKYGML